MVCESTMEWFRCACDAQYAIGMMGTLEFQLEHIGIRRRNIVQCADLLPHEPGCGADAFLQSNALIQTQAGEE